jgi:hypothetical protein
MFRFSSGEDISPVSVLTVRMSHILTTKWKKLVSLLIKGLWLFYDSVNPARSGASVSPGLTLLLHNDILVHAVFQLAEVLRISHESFERGCGWLTTSLPLRVDCYLAIQLEMGVR